MRASSLAEAIDACARGFMPYAGATELVPAMDMGLLRPTGIVSIRNVPELRDITVDVDGHLRIGAAATHRSVAKSPVIHSALPLLAEIADRIGNIRVRAAGTVGGNVAFAEPRSDLITILSALRATIHIAGARGTRTLGIGEFILGAYDTDLAEDELLAAIEVDTGVDFATFEKFVGAERPIVAAALVRRGPSYTVAVGAVGEQLYLEDFGSLEEIDSAAVAAAVDVVPDLAGGEEYKRHLAKVAVGRCLATARTDHQGRQWR